MRANLGEFVYEDFPFEKKLGPREYREAAVLENGARYEGEWIPKTDVRQGRGIQVWPDGSMYEGYWMNSKAMADSLQILESRKVYVSSKD